MKSRETTYTAITYELTEEESNILFQAEKILTDINILFKNHSEEIFEQLILGDVDIGFDDFSDLATMIARIRKHSEENFTIYVR